MQMQRYETLILAVPEITNDESNEIQKSFDKKIRELGGSIVSYDRWGKFQLAYPIRRNDYGVYYLARFEVPEDKKKQSVHDIRELFAIRFNDVVMRHLSVQLAADAPLNYKRPLSLEETPREMDSFFKGGGNRTGYGPRSAGPRQPIHAPEVAPTHVTAPTETVGAELESTEAVEANEQR